MKITCLEMRNSKLGRYHVVYGLAAWPDGTVTARGWKNAITVYEREATADEVAEQRESPRFLCFRYPSWAQLAADEAKYGVCANAARAAWRAVRGLPVT